jgi:DNA polymerase-3 subunit gamma/tau
MAAYQVISRKYRPQTFSAVVGQNAVVTTLKNAIAHQRLAHAYLFCGSRGTGKTTLARIFAKALNCIHLTNDNEPCGECHVCREIASGNSLDVLEIDGASHRGIEDIRQINETVGYTAAGGKYKIYIIDEVHMLTKEAFNALLKTLEEPPPQVKFLFATTEPHKLPPTILSRCQRFNLQRLTPQLIVAKLENICRDLNLNIESNALYTIAKRAEGGLRDAESLLDQAIAFAGSELTALTVADLFGLMPREALFELDQAGKRGDLAAAFTVSEQLFNGGKDFTHFVEMLIEHIRNLLIIKVSGIDAPQLLITDDEREAYTQSAAFYTTEQCMTVLDMLIEAQSLLRTTCVPRFTLEALLLRLLRSHHRIPLDFLVKRLANLEAQAAQLATTDVTNVTLPAAESKQPIALPAPAPVVTSQLRQEELPLSPQPPLKDYSPNTTVPPASKAPTPVSKTPSVSPSTSQQNTQPATAALPQHRYDTLLQFAAVELEGSVQFKKIQRS